MSIFPENRWLVLEKGKLTGCIINRNSDEGVQKIRTPSHAKPIKKKSTPREVRATNEENLIKKLLWMS